MTNELTDISADQIDKSIDEITWYSDTEILFVANTIQLNKLYKVNFKNAAKPEYTLLPVGTNTLSYSSIIAAVNNGSFNYIIAKKSDIIVLN